MATEQLRTCDTANICQPLLNVTSLRDWHPSLARVPRRLKTQRQVLAALGVYQMATAIMEESATLALGHSTRLAITLGAPLTLTRQFRGQTNTDVMKQMSAEPFACNTMHEAQPCLQLRKV